MRGCSFSISSMESIYQSRGFIACLKAGFTLVLANPKKVLKAMWILILIIAISDVLLYAFAQKTSVDILQLKLEPGTWLAMFGMYGTMFLQIFLAIFGLFYFGRYMIKREEKKYKVKIGRLILHNFFPFLGIFLMSSFLAVLLTLIPDITFIVCKWAYGNCVLSQMLYGDVTSIPTSGYVLMMVIGAIGVAVSEYIGLVVPASLIYKYGSAVYDEQNK